MPFVTAILDFIYTIYQDVRGDAAKFQYLTPIVIAASMVGNNNSVVQIIGSIMGSVVCVSSADTIKNLIIGGFCGCYSIATCTSVYAYYFCLAGSLSVFLALPGCECSGDPS